MSHLLALVMSLCIVPAGAEQNSQPGPASGTVAVVRGKVQSPQDRQPLRRAVVRAIPADASLGAAVLEPATSITDALGGFELRVPPGRYQITASKPGFVTAYYADHERGETAKTIVVDGKAPKEGVNISLYRGGAISGLLFDDFGDPAASVPVTAKRITRRGLVRVGTGSTTNDLGQFRVFGLPAGSYLLVAEPLSSLRVDERDSIGTTFYPGVTGPEAAEPVRVGQGQDLVGISFGLVTNQRYRIYGTVVDAAGKPVPNATVFLTQQMTNAAPEEPISISRAGAQTGVDGEFSITNVAAGQYFVESLNRQLKEMASVKLNVASDVPNVTLQMARGSSVRGRVEFLDTRSMPAPPPTCRVADIPLRGARIAPSGFLSSRIGPDWSFEVSEIVKGARTFRLRDCGPNLRVVSVTQDGRDVTDEGVEFPVDSVRHNVVMAVETLENGLHGTAQTSDGTSIREYVVVAFSVSPALWHAPDERYIRVARPDSAGEFAMRAMPAGEYFLAALHYLEDDQLRDDEFLGRLASEAERVVVDADRVKVVKLTPAGQRQ